MRSRRVLDVRILNGTVVSDGTVRPLDVGIEGGQISEIEEPGALGRAAREIDATGLHVMPGAIDVHFHCRAPGRAERGDFASETAAAAAGGVTTIFEMPIADPACSNPDVFRSRRALAESQAHVNFALYSGAVLGSEQRTIEMAELGAIGFKLFTIAPAADRSREFEGLWATDESLILESLSSVASTGLVCVVHAENDQLVRYFAARPSPDGVVARPPVVESAAIATVSALARAAGADTHIAHVTSDAALEAVRAARALGCSVSAETCPQYLVLDERALEAHGGIAKVAPPLRRPEDADLLWDALIDGTLDLVASDHSPFLVHEKSQPPFAEAPQGLPTVELLVPTVLHAARSGRLALEVAVSLVTSAPAKRFGLYPRKGTLTVGSDADIAIVAIGERFLPSPGTFTSRARGCAVVFDGLVLDARVKTTVVGGQLVYDRGGSVSDHAGRFTAGRAAALEKV
jgi:allantoinase